MTVGWAILGAAALAAVALQLGLSLFTPVPRRALRVLMYHRVGEGGPDRFTVTVAQLERQLAWLLARGYALVRLEDVVAHVERGAALPARAVLLTFDDGTADQHDLALPVLRRAGAPAAFFVVPGFTGETRDYDGRRQRFLSEAELRATAAGGVALALHTLTHANLARASAAEVDAEVRGAAAALGARALPFVPALAYPYGAYPRRPATAREPFLAAVRRAGVAVAFRIGNRVNPLPLRAPLEIQRIEVRGDEPFWAFAWKVWKGRRAAL